MKPNYVEVDRMIDYESMSWKEDEAEKRYRCSFCGGYATIAYDHNGRMFEFLSDNCPHCGADMRGEIND